MLASKSPFPAPLGSSSNQSSSQYTTNMSGYRVQHATASSNHGYYTSPTESEFSENFDTPDSVRYINLDTYIRAFQLILECRNWNEERVAEWLRSINCSQYIELFRSEWPV